MQIISVEPIAQDIEIDGVKYYWVGSRMDVETLPRFINTFITTQSSETSTKKVEE